MNKLYIGIAGKAEHGKTETARVIKEHCESQGLVCEVFEISEIIRLHCVNLGFLPYDLPRKNFKPEHIKILVDEGNRMRAVDSLHWTRQVIFAMVTAEVDVAVTPNIRFPQEGSAIQDLGGYVLRLDRLNDDGSPFVSTTRDPNDVTETSLDKWAANFYLTNVTGHPFLLDELVITVFEYMRGLHS